MKRNPPKPHRIKPYFCYDEDLRFHRLIKKCGGKALFKSIIKVMGKQGTKDLMVIKSCNSQNLHIITHNTKDYRNPSGEIKIGIICDNCLLESKFVSKFLKLLRFYPKHENYYHKLVLIGNAVLIRDRKTEEIRLL